MGTSPWERDDIQFPRLLAEMYGIKFTSEQERHLCESMDLDWNEICEVMERADEVWEKIKIENCLPTSGANNRSDDNIKEGI